MNDTSPAEIFDEASSVRAVARRVIGLVRPERTVSEPVRLSAAQGCG
jgi:hypothetical protein